MQYSPAQYWQRASTIAVPMKPTVRVPPRTADRSSQRELLKLLAERHRALCHEWRLSQLHDSVDDDLLPVRHRVEDALTEVGLAIARVDTGDYGICQRCGAAIDFQRLLALPTARRCWACQQSTEQERDDVRPH